MCISLWTWNLRTQNTIFLFQPIWLWWIFLHEIATAMYWQNNSNQNKKYITNQCFINLFVGIYWKKSIVFIHYIEYIEYSIRTDASRAFIILKKVFYCIWLLARLLTKYTYLFMVITYIISYIISGIDSVYIKYN